MNPTTPGILPTLRCNQTCPYCSIGHERARFKEIGAEAWMRRLAKFPDRNLVITGGEPQLYGDLYALLNLAAKKRVVWVYSNLLLRPDIGRLPGTSTLVWRASCHASTRDEARAWLDNVHALGGSGYRVQRTVVYPPPAVLETLREAQAIVVDVPQVQPTPVAPPVSCTIPRIFLAPNGVRYHCIGAMVHADAAGVVGDNDDHTIVCRNPVRCAACDGVASKRTAISNESK